MKITSGPSKVVFGTCKYLDRTKRTSTQVDARSITQSTLPSGSLRFRQVLSSNDPREYDQGLPRRRCSIVKVLGKDSREQSSSPHIYDLPQIEPLLFFHAARRTGVLKRCRRCAAPTRNKRKDWAQQSSQHCEKRNILILHKVRRRYLDAVEMLTVIPKILGSIGPTEHLLETKMRRVSVHLDEW